MRTIDDLVIEIHIFPDHVVHGEVRNDPLTCSIGRGHTLSGIESRNLQKMCRDCPEIPNGDEKAHIANELWYIPDASADGYYPARHSLSDHIRKAFA